MSGKQAKRARRALREAAAADTTEMEFKRPEPVRRIIYRHKSLIDFEKNEKGMKVKTEAKVQKENIHIQYKAWLQQSNLVHTPESWEAFKRYVSKQEIN